MSEHSITRWIQGLQGGSEQAAEQIWRRFFERLCRLASSRLGSAGGGASDAEDIALSAMHALVHGAREDRFERLASRDDLWALLACIATRKVLNAKRATGARPEVGESNLEAEMDLYFEGKPTRGLNDEHYLEALSIATRESLEHLEPNLREAALLRLQGYTHEEIGQRLGRSERTIDRYMRMVRHSFSKEEERGS